MELNIIEITKKIAVVSPSISSDWPSFVRWVSTQLVKREITIYYDTTYEAWSDNWGYHGEKNPGYWNSKKVLADAVPSTEIIGFFKAPPVSLSDEEAMELRENLIEMGYLVAYRFRKNRSSSIPCNSIIQFRI